MQQPPAAPDGARCALHADQAAGHTCRRCGNFMCAQCSQNGTQSLCPTCCQLAGGGAFPYSRQDFDFTRVWDYAFEAWKREWLMLSVCVLILFVLGLVGGIAGSVINQVGLAIAGKDLRLLAVFIGVGFLATQLLSFTVQGIGTLGLARVSLDVLQGRNADVSRMFSQLKKLPRYVVLVLLVGLVVVIPVLLYLGLLLIAALAAAGLSLASVRDGWGALEGLRGATPVLILLVGLLVLVIAMTFLLLPFTFLSFELTYGDCGPWEAVERCWLLAGKFRAAIFGYGFVGGLVTLLGFLACCVGVIPAFGLQQLLLGGLYLSLREGSGLPPPPEP